MSYLNVFNKLDQDIANQIQTLQAKQQELLERKKSLLTVKQKIQSFMTSAEEIKKILETQPELMKTLQKEMITIFTPNNQIQEPKLPLKKDNNTPNLEEKKDLKNFTESKVEEENEMDLEIEEESIRMFSFVDSQGKNTSF